jgi:hypothetical protein
MVYVGCVSNLWSSNEPSRVDLNPIVPGGKEMLALRVLKAALILPPRTTKPRGVLYNVTK